jgi:hypothetical protein
VVLFLIYGGRILVSCVFLTNEKGNCKIKAQALLQQCPGKNYTSQSVKDRVKAHRHSKLESSNTKVFCSVCNENVLCTSDPALSLAHHKASSSKHKRLLQGIYFVDDSDSDMEIAEADSSMGCREGCPDSPAENSNDGIPSTKHVRFESPIDEVLLMNDIVPYEAEVDASMSIEVDRIPDERELLLVYSPGN